jgi:RNA polymerase sigma-70 factor (ECF subfamily)
MKTDSSFRLDVAKLHGNLLSFAMKLTLNKDEAEDLVQETTLKALANEDKYQDGTNIKGWLQTIMRNIFINNYRKCAKTKVQVDTEADLYQPVVVSGAGLMTPDSCLDVKEISAIIALLPDDYRKPFNMYLAGYKYEEISKALNMSMGTVKSHIYTTRMGMRKLLKDFRD